MMNDNFNNFSDIPSNKIVKHLFETQRDFIILGLCGKTGSGVSSAASILEEKFNDLHLNAPCNNNDLNAHEYKKIYTYAKEKWMKFYKIKTTALITRYILSEDSAKFLDFLVQIHSIESSKIKDAVDRFFNDTMSFNVNEIEAESGKNMLFNKKISEESKKIINEEWEKFRKAFKEKDGDCSYKLDEKINICFKIEDVDDKKNIEIANKELSKLFEYYSKCRLEKKILEFPILYLLLYKYLYSFLPERTSELWNEIRNIDKGLPTVALQCMGINLRLSKNKYYFSEYTDLNGIDNDGFNVMAEDINHTIKVFRACKYNFKLYEEKTMLVIDSIKNPYESMYLKNRYSNYYLIGIYTNEEDRKRRLRIHKHLNDDEIRAIDIIEQNSEFKKKIKKYYNSWKEYNENSVIEEKINEAISNDENESKMVLKILKLLHIKVKILKNLDIIAPFVLQNISECIDSADIFINNIQEQQAFLGLKKNLVRYISLIMNPAIVHPTDVERCMQMAYTMKINSGCISRQVGAVITDDKYHILSVGWNSQPEGQLPCSYRDLCEVKYHWSNNTYSDYENDDDNEFQRKIKEQVENFFNTDKSPLREQGKLPSYCFKDYYNTIENNSNQVHTRALHAEEIAFLELAANKERARNGMLFVTASPCELCSKKAMNMGIKKIYYIEPYPGISQQHVLSIGINDRPEQILFTGAIGTAYYRLYTPLMPQKDEYAMWLGKKMDINVYDKIREDFEENSKEKKVNGEEGDINE